MNSPSPAVRRQLQADLETLLDEGHIVSLSDIADAILALESARQADAITLRRWGFRATELRDLRAIGQLDILAVDRKATPWRKVAKDLGGISHVAAQALARRAIPNMLGWLTCA